MEHPQGLRSVREKILYKADLTAEENFELKKGKFFSEIALRSKEVLRLHTQEGLLWDGKGGERWGDVSEHCIVEVARVEELAELLRVPPETRRELATAAALHDFHKRRDIEYTRAHGKNWAAFEAIEEQSKTAMRSAGVPERILEIAQSVAHTSLSRTQELLAKEKLSDHEVACLVMHYVDDYTSGASWAVPALRKEDGTIVNALDKRMERNMQNKDYQLLDQEGRDHFGGRTTFEAQRDIGVEVEKRLADMLSQKTGEGWDPKTIPEKIDALIKKRIESSE
jgi:hypothetical protein